MVSYQRWTSVAYEVAKSKGANLEGTGTQTNNQDLIRVISEVWNDRKGELSTATVAEARDIARQEVTVS
jgi:hypothetical protein